MTFLPMIRSFKKLLRMLSASSNSSGITLLSDQPDGTGRLPLLTRGSGLYLVTTKRFGVQAEGRRDEPCLV